MKNMKRLLPFLLLLAALVLITLYFAVIRPLVNQPSDPAAPPVTTQSGEGVLYNKGTIYPAIRREEMLSITVHNENGTFRFARMGDGENPPTAKDYFVLSREENGSFEGYGLLSYSDERFSELVVATGSFYYLRNLREELPPDTVLDLADYGLADRDSLPWFEIKTLAGETRRVYIGDAAVTDGGYYVLLDGRESTVYVSNSNAVGEAVLTDITKYIEPILTTPYVQYGYYYTQEFTLWRHTAATHRVTAQDTVRYVFRSETDGVLSAPQSGSTDMRSAIPAFVAAFLGKTAGEAPFSFPVTYPSDDTVKESLRGKTVTYHIDEIRGIDKIDILLNFLNKSERDPFHSGCAYTIDAPAEKTAYTPHSQRYMGILETVLQLTGSEVVDIGLTRHPELIEKHGLTAYTIYYESPTAIEPDSKHKDDVLIKDTVPNYLYISEKQDDGTYLVGSVLTDIIARVDGSVFAFLEEDEAWWLEDMMYTVNITDLTEISFDFQYLDKQDLFAFSLDVIKGEDGKPSLREVTYLGNGESVEQTHFKSLYMHLVTIRYPESYDGALPKEEVMAGTPVLSMKLTLQNGKEYTYRFYPYSPRHTLVSVAVGDGEEGAYFYVLSSDVEKIYRDIALILSGECPNPDKQY